MALWMTALFLLLITPVRLGAALRWERGLPRAALGAMVWGVSGQIRLHSARDETGRLLLTASLLGKTVPVTPGKARTGRELRALWLAFRSNGSPGWLRHAFKVRALEAAVRVGGQDAAHLALTVGLIRAAASAAPRLRIHCVPALGEKTAASFRCIADTRLGILLAAALLWRVPRRRGRKEEKPWIIPSGA